MGIAENKKVVSGFIEALASGNVDVLNSTLADDAVWWLPGSLPVSGTHQPAVPSPQRFEDGFRGLRQRPRKRTAAPDRQRACSCPAQPSREIHVRGRAEFLGTTDCQVRCEADEVGSRRPLVDCSSRRS